MTTPIPCPQPEAIEQLLLGHTAGPQAELLELHVEQCARCLEVVRALRLEDPLVAVVRAGARETPIPASGLRDSLMYALCRLPQTALSISSPPSLRDRAEEALTFLAAPRQADEIGRFGPYGILRVLGAGGMGIVFAARQSQPLRVVALKLILDGSRGRHLRSRFHTETAIVARLEHPNIVRVYEVGEYEGRPYFTMEYLEGGNLSEQLAVAPLTPRLAAERTEALARAVQFAHERSCLHRDLKPANVLLAADGTPRISDFGLAKNLRDVETDDTSEDQTQSGAILGTPSYMAPEQTQGAGSASVGPLADVYGLGAILYECLTGRPPFRAATVLDTLQMVRSQEPVAPVRLQPGLPRDLQTICLKCLEKEPARRYGSAALLADDLGRFLRGEPIRARPVSWRERMWKWARRQPALAILSGVGVLLGGGLVVGAVVYESSLRAAVQQARWQQERADKNYRNANETLNRMLGRLMQRQVGEAPQLKRLQHELLEEILPFFQRALEEADGADPGVQLDTARACKWMGDIQHVLGRREAAAEAYRRAIVLVKSLPEKPLATEEATLHVLHGCHNNLGLLAADSRRWEEARGHHHTALAVGEELVRRWPALAVSSIAVAQSEQNLGAVAEHVGDYKKAEHHYSRAVAIRAEQFQAFPDNDRYREWLGESHLNLADIYRLTRRNAAATQSYEKADGLLRGILSRHPARGDVALTLATLNTNWSYLPGHTQEALRRLNEAVELSESVLRREPEHDSARQRTYNARGARAQLYETLGQWANAVKDWDRVVVVDNQPGGWIRRTLRALALARAGDHVRATQAAADLEKDREVSDQGLYNVASVYSLSSKAVAASTEGSASERQALIDRYGKQGIALLMTLRMRGYFESPRNIGSLITDKDLAPLRARAEFRQLRMRSQDGK